MFSQDESAGADDQVVEADRLTIGFPQPLVEFLTVLEEFFDVRDCGEIDVRCGPGTVGQPASACSAQHSELNLGSRSVVGWGREFRCRRRRGGCTYIRADEPSTNAAAGQFPQGDAVLPSIRPGKRGSRWPIRRRPAWRTRWYGRRRLRGR